MFQASVSAPAMMLLQLMSVSLLVACAAALSAAGDGRRPYIVHMDVAAMPAPFSTHEGWYLSVLSSLTAATAAEAPEHLYTYAHVLHGFSAVLTARQLRELEGVEGHVAAFPETYARLHTTRTPAFLGLSGGGGVWPASNYGDDVIIGVVDTGVWPESESFRDAGVTRPVPARWKGACEGGAAFNATACNRKLIGARSFSKALKRLGLRIPDDDYDSPRDYYGHGSHTSSTAAGAAVRGASYFGYAGGTATGVAPMARVAMYKAVFSVDTLESASSDVLAAMDQAIADGVDVMTLSLGFPETPYHTNVIAIGAFAAMQKGIFVVCSAGNDGADGYTVMNGAPWITTVGAATIDRDFTATVTLGGGATTVRGKSVYPGSPAIAGAALYYGHGNKRKQRCLYNSLSSKEVSGKYVFCNNAGGSIQQQMDEVQSNNGSGVIVTSAGAEELQLQPTDYVMPLVVVAPADAVSLQKYAATARAPTVGVRFAGTAVGVKPAPAVSYFSARGPGQITPAILKPDVVAPGVDVLAAWVPNKDVMEITSGRRLRTKYMLLSGTSMASPHVAGVAALLRSVHRDWSPAAIRSAMMTTAYVKDNAGGAIASMPRGSPGTPLDYGSGHVSPNQAADPGLVYDLTADDYVSFLCGLHYTIPQIRTITGRRSTSCTAAAGANADLNYPSFMVILNQTKTGSAATATRTFRRVLTNVAGSPANYTASVTVPAGMKVTVAPPALSFGGKGGKQGFSVTVQISQVKRRADNNYIGNHGFLSWNEVGGKHVVTSPIVSAFAQ